MFVRLLPFSLSSRRTKWTRESHQLVQCIHLNTQRASAYGVSLGFNCLCWEISLIFQNKMFFKKLKIILCQGYLIGFIVAYFSWNTLFHYLLLCALAPTFAIITMNVTKKKMRNSPKSALLSWRIRLLVNSYNLVFSFHPIYVS